SPRPRKKRAPYRRHSRETSPSSWTRNWLEPRQTTRDGHGRIPCPSSARLVRSAAGEIVEQGDPSKVQAGAADVLGLHAPELQYHGAPPTSSKARPHAECTKQAKVVGVVSRVDHD